MFGKLHFVFILQNDAFYSHDVILECVAPLSFRRVCSNSKNLLISFSAKLRDRLNCWAKLRKRNLVLWCSHTPTGMHTDTKVCVCVCATWLTLRQLGRENIFACIYTSKRYKIPNKQQCIYVYVNVFVQCLLKFSISFCRHRMTSF